MIPRFEDRPFQHKAIADMRDALRVHNSIILCAPTGSGKTAIACDATAKAVKRGRSVIFIGDSTEIIEQTSATMDYWGIGHGIIQAGNSKRAPWESAHIATIQTLRNRALPKKDIVFIDECHLSRAKSWHEVIAKYISAGAKVIGLSATPCRLDGKGLGALFQEIIYCPSIQELTALGYLVPLRIFAPPAPNLSKVGSLGGDFRKDKLSAAMDKPRLIGDAVAHYGKLAHGRLAILAASSIEHSKHLTAAFNAAGVPAAHCDGTTAREERRRILKSLPAREIMVLCQVDICGKGWDCREVSCAIDLRPTESMARYLQFVGRVLRCSEGKADAILLDHSGNVHRHGMPDEPRDWSLDGTAPRAAVDEPRFPVSTCHRCFATFRPGPDKCPYCGVPVLKRERKVEVLPGELEEIRRQEKAAAIAKHAALATDDSKRAKFRELVELGEYRQYKPGWAKLRFKLEFGHWPPRSWLTAGDDDPDYTDPTWEAGEAALRATRESFARRSA